MNEISPLTRRLSLPEEVARSLREQIISGTLSPGERLPAEQGLGASYGVSRAVIREAISRLRYDGLVESRQGLGAFVSQTGHGTSFRINPEAIRDPNELRKIYELRMSVEVDAAGFAAERRTKSDLRHLEQSIALMHEAIRFERDGVEADLMFHRLVAAATHNNYFVEFMRFLGANLGHVIKVARASSAKQNLGAQKDLQEHIEIYEAIRASDVERARLSARSHLQNAILWLEWADSKPQGGPQAEDAS